MGAVGWAIREGMQGQGCLERQVGPVLEARQIPTPKQSG